MICSRDGPSGSTCGATGPFAPNGLLNNGRWQVAPEPANSAVTVINQASEWKERHFNTRFSITCG
jgi:hypothetical protein